MNQSKFPKDRFFKASERQVLKLKQLDACIAKLIQSNSVEGFPPGIFINEHHDHIFPKEFLIANFQYFRKIGIKTFFFEFADDEDQHLFDSALNSEGVAALDAVVIRGNDHTKAVAIAAIQAGIRVVVLDCKKAREGSPEYFRHPTKEDWDAYYKKRDCIFDENARRIFNKEHQSKPYLFYSGLAHGNNNHGFPSFFPGPKISLLLSDDDFNFHVNGIKEHLHVDEILFSRDLGRNYCLDSTEERALAEALFPV
ncbi:hypothetical protein Lqui_0094 [Legionella quinlivanii]|uniref:Uncharacterized protein n=1 Tax=Legionella quinlivanii TaxID=45073 RepID=A0A0W0Y6P9_9GAMM|nr:hypothetical protein [Legionella quinlivanii]KTD52641.1 hypothetical protein Lqui_0094 [Legionella quinlivanii]SEG25733.1 hypothetical protein SAMN02746093_02332 [Legionella quinlivanii DSM 21216]STY10321.1 Uncharacterised protein [Legionella quinlivanii]